MKQIEHCGICGANNFESVWELPNFPLTERFGDYNPILKLSFDQELLICINCGHVQLKNQLNPLILYASEDYSFRSSESKSAIFGTAFFIDFVKRISENRQFKSLLDVGGNDLYLSKLFSSKVANRYVVDPICSAIDGQIIDGIKVIGRMIEDVDLSKDIEVPDLVFCRHTLEHISDPSKVLKQLFSECNPDCLYFFEIPCFENLSEALRFDAIFHQHYHYYDLSVFKQLLFFTGGQYIAHAYNYQGSCGGALLIAFKKAEIKLSKTPLIIKERIKNIKKRIKYYESQMNISSHLLDELPKPIYGYGASLMLATLSYHIKSDFSQLECILDDDIQKDNISYKNIPIIVHHPSIVKPNENSSYLITSLENMRPIYKRIQELKPRRILVPVIS